MDILKRPCGVILAAITAALVVWGGRVQDTSAQPSPLTASTSGSAISSDLEQLLLQEKQNPVTGNNVQERYQILSRIVSSLLRSGMMVGEILPREEALKIESFIRAGNAEEAVQPVHNAILRLEKVDTAAIQERQEWGNFKQPSPSGEQGHLRSRMRNGGGVGRGPGRADRGGDMAPVNLTQPMQTMNIHAMVTHLSFDNVLKLMNPVIDQARRRLYFCGSKSTYMGIVDLDRDELVETFDMGVPGGFLLLSKETGDLYMLDIPTNKTFKIDMSRKKAEPAPMPEGLLRPKKEPKIYENKSYLDTGFPFRAGYMQDDNAAYGVIEVRDGAKNLVDKIKHGPDALYFDIDEVTGKLYATNTGDGSISVFDLKNQNRKIKDIDVGSSVDELLFNNDSGGLVIRNRLGGSVIYILEKSGGIRVVPNENQASGGIGVWPTQIILNEGKLYVLSHYAGGIDIVDIASGAVTNRVQLDLSRKPRTDAISTMTLDRTRKIIYAAFPELGEIAVVDVASLKPVKTIKLANFDLEKTGPGRIVLAVDEIQNRLFVYMSDEHRLVAYSGPASFTAERTIYVDAGKAERLMTPNSEKGLLYLGNLIYDSSTLEKKGEFEKGKRVVAFDNQKNRVYLSGFAFQSSDKMGEWVYEYEGKTLKREWTLPQPLSIQSSFAFDLAGGRMYVGRFEAAKVDVYDLTRGAAPAPVSGNAPADKRMGGQGGYCGDGICQPIEKSKGVCPQDCPAEGVAPQGR